MDELFGYFNVFLLVFARMGGMILANPIFARRNVPARVKIGLVLAISLLLAPNLDGTAVASLNDFEMITTMVKEVMFGFGLGFVFYFFFYMLYVAGDLMDTVFGLAMSKIFDPISGVQMSSIGNFLTILFILYFFATGSHLIMIKIFTYSYELVPLGNFSFHLTVISKFFIDIFSSAFLLCIKLTLPFVAAELIVEVAMGILMKLVPQIHVFVINMQFKILTAILLMFFFAQPIGDFIERYIGTMITEMQNFMQLI